MQHKGTIRIETDRLILRPFQMTDADAMYRNWESDEKVTEFLRWPTASDPADAEEVLAEWVGSYSDPSFYQWAIELKELGEPIGSISAVGKNERTGAIHVGYCIGSKWWRRGYTSEAFAAIISFFFDEVKANRIESQHDPNNPNSGRVMQKCGLRYEGTLRQADWSNKGIVDACMYAILKEEYNQSKA